MLETIPLSEMVFQYLCGTCHLQPHFCSRDGCKRRGRTGALSPSSVLVPAEGWARPFPVGSAAACSSTMPAPLCAVCGWLALAFDFMRFWRPLAFLGVPTELTICQGTEQDFCRVFCCFFFFSCCVISGLF